MNIPAEVREKAPQGELQNLDSYVDRVWKLLMSLKPGDVVVVEKLTKPETRDLFIEVAKWYMREHRNTYMDGLTFTRGFVAIQKYDVAWLMQKKTGKGNNVTV